MKLSELKALLDGNGNAELKIFLADGNEVGVHFHVTEVGLVQKKFIDCGGTVRESTTWLLQIWTAHDVDHRLKPSKLSKILDMAGAVLGDGDHEVQVEYGDEVAATYDLFSYARNDEEVVLFLRGKKTDCLAPDKCGVSACAPGSGCC